MVTENGTLKKKPAVRKTPVKVSSKKEISEEDIRIKAYELYVQRGCSHGSDMDDWLAAKELISQSK